MTHPSIPSILSKSLLILVWLSAGLLFASETDTEAETQEVDTETETQEAETETRDEKVVRLAKEELAGQKDSLYVEDEWPKWMWEEERPRPWYFTGALGYSLFTPHDGEVARSGGGLRLASGYAFNEAWRLGLRFEMTVYDGKEKASDSYGLYSQVATLAETGYYFSTGLEWLHPFLVAGLGWQRTQLDIETKTRYSTHSLLAEIGGGVLFGLTPAWWLGFEITGAMAFLGHEDIASTFNNRYLFNVEYRF